MLMGAYRKYILTMGIVWSASLVLFALVYYVVIAPQLKVKSQLLEESTEKQKMFESALSAANDDNKKKLAGEVEELKTRLIDYVSEYEESANLTFAVSRIAGDKQVSAFAVKTSEVDRQPDPLTAKNLQENKMEISFASDFLQFVNFINTLERHQPVVFVDRFRVQRDSQGGAANKVDMSLSFFVRKKLDG
jgi:Type II secretion system (T2SS), protein M subtype b